MGYDREGVVDARRESCLKSDGLGGSTGEDGPEASVDGFDDSFDLRLGLRVGIKISRGLWSFVCV